MGTKIIVNGREYASVDAMPDSVRQVYEQALAQFADKDRNGIPDVMERAAAGNTIHIQQSSINVNGQTYNSVSDMPEHVRRRYEQVLARVDANRDGVPDVLESPTSASQGLPPDGTVPGEVTWTFDATSHGRLRSRDQSITALDRTSRALNLFLRTLLVSIAIAVIVAGTVMIVSMDASSASQGGRFYVGIGVLVVLGLVISKYMSLRR